MRLEAALNAGAADFMVCLAAAFDRCWVVWASPSTARHELKTTAVTFHFSFSQVITTSITIPD
jgi:hypothetical protein